MHVKQLQTVITFPSTAAALEMERRAKTLAIPGRLIPTPAAIVATCGLSWMVRVEDGETVRAMLAEHNIVYSDITQISL